ncbi:MAG: NUDIX domain-containing protein [Lysinibacillus sp.]
MYTVVVEGVIQMDGRWLLIKRSMQEEHEPGAISLVGGRVETTGFSYDVLEQSLKREVCEEINITIEEKMQYLWSSCITTKKGEQVVTVVFLCNYDSGEIRIGEEDEVADILYMDTDAILGSIDIPEYVKKSIQLAAACLEERVS